MTLQPHQQRVVDERIELVTKLHKLVAFIARSPIYEGLAEEDKELLRSQFNAMADYNNILVERISRFG